MTQLRTLEADLSKAQDALTALQNELPQFHALLTENEQDAQRLKGERAPLDAQAQARGRVGIAREMLEQHQSDVANARAEVGRLEALLSRERTLLEMVAQAKTAKAHRAAMDKALEDATRALHQASETFLREWQAEREVRQEFAETGRSLVPHFKDISFRADPGMPKRVILETLAAELTRRGAPLDDVTDGATGKHTALDVDRRYLPNDGLSMAVWDAIRLLGGHEAQWLTRTLPTRSNAAIMPPYLSPPSGYGI